MVKKVHILVCRFEYKMSWRKIKPPKKKLELSEVTKELKATMYPAERIKTRGYRSKPHVTYPYLMEPFGHTLFRGIANAHERCLNRTVMIKDNDVDTGMRVLNRFLSKEGLMAILRRSKAFERPCDQRNRLAYEFARDVYQEDMARKVAFLMRANRKSPYDGLF